MNRIYPSPTLVHLRARRSLNKAVEKTGQDLQSIIPLLKRLLSSNVGLLTDDLDPDLISSLYINHLIQFQEPDPGYRHLPFCFVDAVNYELTYTCNFACSHCLQSNLRNNDQSGWINSDAVIQTISDAEYLGLLRTGINFTGGEIFRDDSPVMDLLAVTKDHQIPTRVNTNAWWGEHKDIIIGDHTYTDDREIILALKDYNLAALALSLDNRYFQYPELFSKVIRVAVLCEEHHLPYQVVATEPKQDLQADALKLITEKLGKMPAYMSYVPMEMVDIGANAIREKLQLNVSNLFELIYSVDCGGLGFHQPNTLHISPHGGVRSCLYAPSGGWLGNIYQQSLTVILNNIPTNPVYRLFKFNMIESIIESYLEPWQHIYRKINHSCIACALIARLVEEISLQEKSLDRKLINQDLKEIHQKISQEYNLSL